MFGAHYTRKTAPPSPTPLNPVHFHSLKLSSVTKKNKQALISGFLMNWNGSYLVRTRENSGTVAILVAVITPVGRSENWNPRQRRRRAATPQTFMNCLSKESSLCLEL